MNYDNLDLIINSAFDAALNDGKRVLQHEIAPNTTLQTDVYETKRGSGFRVVCRINNPEERTTTIRVRNYGPDVNSERHWTTYTFPYFN